MLLRKSASVCPPRSLCRLAANRRERRPKRSHRHGSYRRRATMLQRPRRVDRVHTRDPIFTNVATCDPVGTCRVIRHGPSSAIATRTASGQRTARTIAIIARAGTDHDGRPAPQRLEERGGVHGMGRKRAHRFTARPTHTPAVVGDHSSDAGEVAGGRAPCRGGRAGRVDAESVYRRRSLRRRGRIRPMSRSQSSVSPLRYIFTARACVRELTRSRVEGHKLFPSSGDNRTEQVCEL